MIGACFQRKGPVWTRREIRLGQRLFCVSTNFAGKLICMCCVCLYARTHTLHAGYLDVSPGVGTGHLESLEEIHIYCRASTFCFDMYTID